MSDRYIKQGNPKGYIPEGNNRWPVHGSSSGSNWQNNGSGLASNRQRPSIESGLASNWQRPSNESGLASNWQRPSNESGLESNWQRPSKELDVDRQGNQLASNLQSGEIWYGQMNDPGKGDTRHGQTNDPGKGDVWHGQTNDPSKVDMLQGQTNDPGNSFEGQTSASGYNWQETSENTDSYWQVQTGKTGNDWQGQTITQGNNWQGQISNTGKSWKGQTSTPGNDWQGKTSTTGNDWQGQTGNQTNSWQGQTSNTGKSWQGQTSTPGNYQQAKGSEQGDNWQGKVNVEENRQGQISLYKSNWQGQVNDPGTNRQGKTSASGDSWQIKESEQGANWQGHVKEAEHYRPGLFKDPGTNWQGQTSASGNNRQGPTSASGNNRQGLTSASGNNWQTEKSGPGANRQGKVKEAGQYMPGQSSDKDWQGHVNDFGTDWQRHAVSSDPYWQEQGTEVGNYKQLQTGASDPNWQGYAMNSGSSTWQGEVYKEPNTKAEVSDLGSQLRKTVCPPVTFSKEILSGTNNLLKQNNVSILQGQSIKNTTVTMDKNESPRNRSSERGLTSRKESSDTAGLSRDVTVYQSGEMGQTNDSERMRYSSQVGYGEYSGINDDNAYNRDRMPRDQDMRGGDRERDYGNNDRSNKKREYGRNVSCDRDRSYERNVNNDRNSGYERNEEKYGAHRDSHRTYADSYPAVTGQNIVGSNKEGRQSVFEGRQREEFRRPESGLASQSEATQPRFDTAVDRSVYGRGSSQISLQKQGSSLDPAMVQKIKSAHGLGQMSLQMHASTPVSATVQKIISAVPERDLDSDTSYRPYSSTTWNQPSPGFPKDSFGKNMQRNFNGSQLPSNTGTINQLSLNPGHQFSNAGNKERNTFGPDQFRGSINSEKELVVTQGPKGRGKESSDSFYSAYHNNPRNISANQMDTFSYQNVTDQSNISQTSEFVSHNPRNSNNRTGKGLLDKPVFKNSTDPKTNQNLDVSTQNPRNSRKSRWEQVPQETRQLNSVYNEGVNNKTAESSQAEVTKRKHSQDEETMVDLKKGRVSDNLKATNGSSFQSSVPIKQGPQKPHADNIKVETQVVGIPAWKNNSLCPVKACHGLKFHLFDQFMRHWRQIHCDLHVWNCSHCIKTFNRYKYALQHLEEARACFGASLVQKIKKGCVDPGVVQPYTTNITESAVAQVKTEMTVMGPILKKDQMAENKLAQKAPGETMGIGSKAIKQVDPSREEIETLMRKAAGPTDVTGCEDMDEPSREEIEALMRRGMEQLQQQPPKDPSPRPAACRDPSPHPSVCRDPAPRPSAGRDPVPSPSACIHQCNICQLRFKSYQAATKHLLTHSKPGKILKLVENVSAADQGSNFFSSNTGGGAAIPSLMDLTLKPPNKAYLAQDF